MVNPIGPARYRSAPASSQGPNGSVQFETAATTSAMQAAAVPNIAIMDGGLTTMTLIDCMAAMPSGGFSRARASITALENANRNPATRPQPSAVTRVKAWSAPSIVTP